MTPNTREPYTAQEPIRLMSLIARLNVGGPAKLLGWIGAGLDPARFSHTLVAGQVPEGEQDMGPWVESLGVPYLMVPLLGRAINPLKDVRCLAQIFRLLVRIKPHVLATHTAKAGFMGRAALLLYAPLARLMGWPRTRALHTFHGHVFHGYFGKTATGVFLFLERFLAKRATWRVLVISRQQLKEIHGRFKVGRAGQMEVVPIGIDLDQFHDQERGRAEFRRELNLTPDKFLIGAVGRIAAVKHYELVVQTAARLKEISPQAYERSRFVLIGGGQPQDETRLRDLASDLGVDDRFTVLGYRSDPECFFPALDFLLLTSLNEGTPLSILEAGACARPVVSTQVGGVPDLLGAERSQMSPGAVIRGTGPGGGQPGCRRHGPRAGPPHATP